MSTGPLIAEIAALVAEPARASMLSALLDGRALTAGELAYAARVTPQTGSAHLARLTEVGLLSPTWRGAIGISDLPHRASWRCSMASSPLRSKTGRVAVRCRVRRASSAPPAFA